MAKRLTTKTVALPQGGEEHDMCLSYGAINVALKSLTLVRVGPVMRLSPSIWKKVWPSLSSSIHLG